MTLLSDMVDHITVRAGQTSYPVYIQAGALDKVGSIMAPTIQADRACIVSDDTVCALYSQRVAQSLKHAGYNASIISFPAGEQHKNISTLSRILEDFAESELTRTSVVVAVGGGVTGDMAGLASALYMRGCKLVHVPTSLLAMVDSSIGGKTAVDLEHGKNLCGTFTQPAMVIIDPCVLQTLPAHHIASATGEIIKYACIADADLFEELKTRPLIHEAVYTDTHLMGKIIRRCVEIKAGVIAEDERESYMRQILNFGHTLGHALEAASDFQLPHGTCVARGMCMIMHAAAQLEWVDSHMYEQVFNIVNEYGLYAPSDIDSHVLYSYILHDKKRTGDYINIVLTPTIGAAQIRSISLDQCFQMLTLACKKGN